MTTALIDLPSLFVDDEAWLEIRESLKTLDKTDPIVADAIEEVEAELRKRGIGSGA
ncbi:MAG: hypothetical protein IH987_08420 [Planctomycetes bacterium]|nr:hypothetical protein [Planctomycetota bacterium]